MTSRGANRLELEVIKDSVEEPRIDCGLKPCIQQLLTIAIVTIQTKYLIRNIEPQALFPTAEIIIVTILRSFENCGIPSIHQIQDKI